MLASVIVACTVAMLLLFLFQARAARPTGDENPDRFFLSTGAHSTEEYGSAQVAYFLQMATVYPFFTFAFSGQWWLALWNTAFYIVGILIFSKLLPMFTRGGLDLVSKASTAHALIANAHGEPRLRLLASWLSICAFVGLALFETVWGTAALKSVLGGSSYLYYLTIMVFALYLICILWIGGQKAEIRTAQYQLVIAYIGLHLLTAWALRSDKQGFAALNIPLLFPVIFLVGSWASLRRIMRWKQDGTRQMQLLNAAAVASLVYVLYSIARAPGFVSTATFRVSPVAWPAEWFWMLFTLGCLPVFFQFVDMTNWQRLSAISTKPKTVVAEARKGLLFFVVESPLSWLFPIAMGLAATGFVAVTANQDPWVEFLNKASSLEGVGGGFVSVFAVVGMICVFLSTADSLLSATGYAFAYDVHAPTRTLMDRLHASRDGSALTVEERRLVTLTGKVATSAMIGVAVISYVVVDSISADFGTKLLSLFLTFYAPMLSFAPAMLTPILLGRTASPRVAFASMLVSAAAGVGIGIYSVYDPAPIWQWLGVPACFILSWVIYLAGVLFGGRLLDTSSVAGPSRP